MEKGHMKNQSNIMFGMAALWENSQMSGLDISFSSGRDAGDILYHHMPHHKLLVSVF